MCDFADMDLLIGSWNVRSLVECSGDVRICRSRPVSVAVSENVDHKLDLLVKELKRYDVCSRYSRNQVVWLRMSGQRLVALFYTRVIHCLKGMLLRI